MNFILGHSNAVTDMMNGILALTEDQTVSLLWGLSGPQSHSVFSRVTMLLLLLLLPECFAASSGDRIKL